MSKQNKSFVIIIILLLLLVGAAIFLARKNDERLADKIVADHQVNANQEATKNVDGVMEINAQNAPFNSGDENLRQKGRVGYITSINPVADTDSVSIKFDEALFFDGSNAENNVRQTLGCDKSGAPSDCKKTDNLLTNGYYVYNPIHKLFTFSFAADTTFKILAKDSSGKMGIKSVDVAEFIKSIQQSTADDGNANRLFWIVEDNQLVRQIEEQYLPQN